MSSEISECVRRNLKQYFAHLDGQTPHALYAMLLKTVEKPLLEVVMEQAADNQTVAAEILGISRGTLRRMLQDHGLL
jgi:Fis family transcriptional regulator